VNVTGKIAAGLKTILNLSGEADAASPLIEKSIDVVPLRSNGVEVFR